MRVRTGFATHQDEVFCAVAIPVRRAGKLAGGAVARGLFMMQQRGHGICMNLIRAACYNVKLLADGAPLPAMISEHPRMSASIGGI
jgi:hypothetical protein